VGRSYIFNLALKLHLCYSSYETNKSDYLIELRLLRVLPWHIRRSKAKSQPGEKALYSQPSTILSQESQIYWFFPYGLWEFRANQGPLARDHRPCVCWSGGRLGQAAHVPRTICLSKYFICIELWKSKLSREVRYEATPCITHKKLVLAWKLQYHLFVGISWLISLSTVARIVYGTATFTGLYVISKINTLLRMDETFRIISSRGL